LSTRPVSSSGVVERLSFHDILAQVVIVSTTLTFSEEDKKAFGHIHAKELVPISYYGSECCEENSLRDTMISKELAPERSDLKVEFDHQSAVKTLYFCQVIQNKKEQGTDPKGTDDDEEDDLEEMPVPVIRNLEEHKFPGSEGVHSLFNASNWDLTSRQSVGTYRECDCGSECAKEASPDCLDAK